MNSFKLLFAALMDTAFGLLTFNLPMTRVPHSNKSAGLSITVSALASAAEASVGNDLPALILALLCGLVAIDHSLWKQHVPRLPDNPSRLIAATYLLSMTYLIGVAMMYVCDLALPEGLENWVAWFATFWSMLVLAVIAPRIKRHQIALLRAANASLSEPSAQTEQPPAPGADPSNSNQP